MQWHQCNKQLFTYIDNFLEFYFLAKIRVLQTYPLKMNLVLEIQMDQKRNLKMWPSTRLLFPM
jgi:hypothetical protein